MWWNLDCYLVLNFDLEVILLVEFDYIYNLFNKNQNLVYYVCR